MYYLSKTIVTGIVFAASFLALKTGHPFWASTLAVFAVICACAVLGETYKPKK